jgi:hypothetical protein
MEFDFLFGVRHVKTVYKIADFDVTLFADVNGLGTEKKMGEACFP